MDTSKDPATSPSRERETKGRGEPPTTDRRTRPAGRESEDAGRDREDEGDRDEVEDPNGPKARAKQHISEALRELQGGSRPGVSRAQKSLNAALELL